MWCNHLLLIFLTRLSKQCWVLKDYTVVKISLILYSHPRTLKGIFLLIRITFYHWRPLSAPPRFCINIQTTCVSSVCENIIIFFIPRSEDQEEVEVLFNHYEVCHIHGMEFIAKWSVFHRATWKMRSSPWSLSHVILHSSSVQWPEVLPLRPFAAIIRPCCPNHFNFSMP